MCYVYVRSKLVEFRRSCVYIGLWSSCCEIACCLVLFKKKNKYNMWFLNKSEITTCKEQKGMFRLSVCVTLCTKIAYMWEKCYSKNRYFAHLHILRDYNLYAILHLPVLWIVVFFFVEIFFIIIIFFLWKICIYYWYEYECLYKEVRKPHAYELLCKKKFLHLFSFLCWCCNT